MNVEFINPFINAVVNVLETMAFVKPKAGKPYLKQGDSAVGDVSGILGLTGNNSKLKGSLAVTFSEKAILKIVSNMLGEEHDHINSEVCDAVGEITNMISGQARKELSEKGHSMEASIPTVISGKGHALKHVKIPSIVIPFEIDEGTFVVDVCFED